MNEMLLLLSKLKFRGNGTHDDYEGFMSVGILDTLSYTDVVTELRDMLMLLWGNIDIQSREQLLETVQFPLNVSLTQSKLKRLVYELDMLNNQLELFSKKTDDLFDLDLILFKRVLTLFADHWAHSTGFYKDYKRSNFGEKIIELVPYAPKEVELEDFNFWNITRLFTEQESNMPHYHAFINCQKICPETGKKINIISYSHGNRSDSDGQFNKHESMKEATLPYLPLESKIEDLVDLEGGFRLKQSTKFFAELAFNMPHTHFIDNKMSQFFKVAQNICLDQYNRHCYSEDHFFGTTNFTDLDMGIINGVQHRSNNDDRLNDQTYVSILSGITLGSFGQGEAQYMYIKNKHQIVINIKNSQGEEFISSGFGVRFNPMMKRNNSECYFSQDMSAYPEVTGLYNCADLHECVLVFKDGTCAVMKHRYTDKHDLLVQFMNIVGKWGYKTIRTCNIGFPVHNFAHGFRSNQYMACAGHRPSRFASESDKSKLMTVIKVQYTQNTIEIQLNTDRRLKLCFLSRKNYLYCQIMATHTNVKKKAKRKP